MLEMFFNAISFNQSLNNWDLKNINKYKMYSMFNNASSFDKKYALWYNFN